MPPRRRTRRSSTNNDAPSGDCLLLLLPEDLLVAVLDKLGHDLVRMEYEMKLVISHEGQSAFVFHSVREHAKSVARAERSCSAVRRSCGAVWRRVLQQHRALGYARPGLLKSKRHGSSPLPPGTDTAGSGCLRLPRATSGWRSPPWRSAHAPQRPKRAPLKHGHQPRPQLLIPGPYNTRLESRWPNRLGPAGRSYLATQWRSRGSSSAAPPSTPACCRCAVAASAAWSMVKTAPCLGECSTLAPAPSQGAPGGFWLFKTPQRLSGGEAIH